MSPRHGWVTGEGTETAEGQTDSHNQAIVSSVAIQLLHFGMEVAEPTALQLSHPAVTFLVPLLLHPRLFC